jgi:hypothetical protein
VIVVGKPEGKHGRERGRGAGAPGFYVFMIGCIFFVICEIFFEAADLSCKSARWSRQIRMGE